MSRTGIDTNVLLRMVLNDDPEQRAKALAFRKSLTEEQPGYGSLIALVEFNWSLVSRHRRPKQRTLLAIQRFIGTDIPAFEGVHGVVRAFEKARNPKVDFSDALIAEHNLKQGCSRTATSDRKAAMSIPSMELLT